MQKLRRNTLWCDCGQEVLVHLKKSKPAGLLFKVLSGVAYATFLQLFLHSSVCL